MIISRNRERRKHELQKMTNEELNRCKYPNLISEIIESGYSTSTLADFMGLGPRKNGRVWPDYDPEVWDKINGKEEMRFSHALGLCKYYGVDFGYMFSSELAVVCGKPIAYWRWLEENKKKEEELKKIKEKRAIEYKLYSRPELYELMKAAMTLTNAQIQHVCDSLKCRTGAT